jgi:hypothetical protein
VHLPGALVQLQLSRRRLPHSHVGRVAHPWHPLADDALGVGGTHVALEVQPHLLAAQLRLRRALQPAWRTGRHRPVALEAEKAPAGAGLPTPIPGPPRRCAAPACPDAQSTIPAGLALPLCSRRDGHRQLPPFAACAERVQGNRLATQGRLPALRTRGRRIPQTRRPLCLRYVVKSDSRSDGPMRRVWQPLWQQLPPGGRRTAPGRKGHDHDADAPQAVPYTSHHALPSPPGGGTNRAPCGPGPCPRGAPIWPWKHSTNLGESQRLPCRTAARASTASTLRIEWPPHLDAQVARLPPSTPPEGQPPGQTVCEGRPGSLLTEDDQGRSVTDHRQVASPAPGWTRPPPLPRG